jgi:predicted enzyme related to lactoylglutathione lyase
MSLERGKEPKLKLLVLQSPRMAIVRDFYTQFGLVFVEEQHGNGPVHFAAPFGEAVLEIYPLSEGNVADTTTRLGFSVADMTDVFASIQSYGEIVSAPKHTQWGARGVVRDPDGRTVELYQADRGNT